MKKILYIAFRNLKYDSRVSRQLEYLSSNSDFEITCICWGKVELSGVRFIEIGRKPSFFSKVITGFKLLFRAYDNLKYYNFGKDTDKFERLESQDLIIASDVMTLPYAFSLKEKWQADTKVLFDAREYYFNRMFYSLPYKYLVKPYIYKTLDKLVPLCEGFTTVGPKIAELYEKRYKKKPTVILNVPKFSELKPARIGGDDRIKLVHVGVADSFRSVEDLIYMIPALDERYELHLYLIMRGQRYTKDLPGNYKEDYYKGLKTMIEETAKGRIKLHKPVAESKLISTLNSFDIGLIQLKGDNINFRLSLPNKFFQYIQARLMTVTFPFSVEVTKIVKQYELGIITGGFSYEEMVEVLNRLTPEEIMKYKENADRVAKKFSSESFRDKYLRIVEDILKE